MDAEHWDFKLNVNLDNILTIFFLFEANRNSLKGVLHGGRIPDLSTRTLKRKGKKENNGGGHQ